MSAIGQKKSLTILNDGEVSGSEVSTGGVSRRRFLQILGAGTATGLVGCTDNNEQKIFPNLKGDPESIPGVAVWYSSTCTECAAGCGLAVRTRDGRAVKVEGNPDSPVNRGGLCALGQSSLQNHYDPDRIREPLKKSEGIRFVPIKWDEAVTSASSALKANGKKIFLTGEITGALSELVSEFCDAHGFEHITHDVTQQVVAARASELVFGTYGVPAYSFDKAEVVLNFGADYLETWVSPVQYARDWSKGRRAAKPTRVVHVEPRLSLTGASADTWLAAKPGTEIRIALAVLKTLVEFGKGSSLPSDTLAGIKKIVASVTVQDVAEESGVPESKILLLAQWLKDAKRSLVVAGGTAASSSEGLSLHVAANLMNLVLGNLGETVNVAASRKPKSSASQFAKAITAMSKGEVGALIVYGTNPAFTFPSSYGFGEETLKKVSQVVSLSGHLDETTQLADVVLPSSSSFESWGDVRPYPGVYSLVQPSMTQIFDTKSVGDTLLTLSARAGKEIGGGAKDFLSYLKDSWKKVHTQVGVGGDFNKFWNESVEMGGYFAQRAPTSTVTGEVSAEVFTLDYEVQSAFKGAELVLYPYFSVKSFDGRAANRPWMQELPDPITSAVWDGWAELNPKTAAAKGIAQGDMVTIRNYYGEVNVPVYITEHVLPGVIAIPVGQGHDHYGRYAKKVSGGNVLTLIPKQSVDVLKRSGDGVALLVTEVELERGRGRSSLVLTQGSDLQETRELARMSFLGAGAVAAATEAHAEGEEHEHHAPKQMYVQREHPVYQWGLGIDLTACTGCSACVVACYAENNIPVVGKKLMSQGREMSWLRIERYMDGVESEELQVSFLPMMCQHCHNAPCEPVCPVLATYHNEEGLNAMVYNRCVGTRYCSNNCSYKVRRFNFTETDVPEPLSWQLNPDVTKRVEGIMEKCSFCIQRIAEGKDVAKDEGRLVQDGDIQPACVQSCPTQALVFGNLNDPESKVSKLNESSRAYKVLDHHINTQPAVTYLERVKYKA